MEAASQKSVHGGLLKKGEKKTESSSGDDEGCSEAIVHKVIRSRRREQEDDNKKDLTSKQGHIMPKMEISPSELQAAVSNQEDRLKSAKAEMGEVMEENQRLKMYLDRIMKDYRTLQMQFHDIVQQENKPSGSSVTTHQENKPSGSSVTTHQENDQESEFVSLSLGRNSSSDAKKDDSANKSSGKDKVDEEDKGGLALGLDCKFEFPNSSTLQNEQPSTNPSPEISLEEAKEDAGETWSPQKGPKTMRTGDDEASQLNPAKRARVSVRVRCDTPTMSDGCQWRKYGQKIAKGNPCPRAYYRCTVAPNCPVRKQVQRCAEDMSILITTYEGTHNHPLPISATAMASTTSAAACMLLSGSSSSGSGVSQSATTNLSSANINGLNFYISDNSKPKPFYLPNSSISSSASFPTITLDLTTNSSASSHLNKLAGNFPPRYSTTNLNFSSLESGSLPISWSNGVLSYGNQPYNKNQIGSLSFGRQPQETLYQSYLQKHILSSTQQSQLPPETLAAATKAITSDPNFQSALAAALTTIIGSGSSNSATLGSQVAAEKSSQNPKLSEPFPVLSSFPSTSNTNKCAPNFLNKSSSSTSNSQPGSLMFMSPSLPFSTSNSKSTSPGDNRDHIS